MATNVCPRLERLVAFDNQAAVFAIALDRLVGQDAGGSQAAQHDEARDELFHGADRSRNRRR